MTSQEVTRGITLTFTLKKIEDIDVVLARLTDILSTGQLGENARLVPDVDKMAVYLELRNIEAKDRSVQRLVQEYQLWNVGEVDIQSFVVPWSLATIGSEAAQEEALRTISHFEGSPKELDQQLKQILEPKYWILEEVRRLQYKIDSIGSELTALKVRREEELKAHERRIAESTLKDQKYYGRTGIWVQFLSLIVALVAIIITIVGLLLLP